MTQFENAQVLKENIEIGYILPCKVVVYEKNNDHYLGILKPTIKIIYLNKMIFDTVNSKILNCFGNLAFICALLKHL